MRHWVRGWVALALASWLALYCQLLVIRWLSAEIRIFTYLKNLPLLAAFLGLGIGSALAARAGRDLYPLFAPLALLLAAIVTLARPLGLIHVPLPSLPGEFWAWTETPYHAAEWGQALAQGAHFLAIVLALTALAASTFVPLGHRVGRAMADLPRVPAYALNLISSLAGVLTFVAVSALQWPPAAWWVVAIVPAIALVFLSAEGLRPSFVWAGAALLGLIPVTAAVGALTVAGPTVAGGVTLWSPYYRLDFAPMDAHLDASPVLSGSGTVLARDAPHYQLRVNYDYHQRALDLSDSAVRGPGAAGLRPARDFYDLPYRLLSAPPGRVLIVGSGMGNDVAAAVRARAGAVDAVEIDPAILRLGALFHPERPYAAPSVRAINDDARSHFRRAERQSSGNGYDLIVFGLLDSHAALATLAGLRLDSYVYTREALSEARSLLTPEGSLVLSFGTKPAEAIGDAARPDDGWLARRLFRVLTDVFATEPVALDLTYDGSTMFVSGAATARPPMRESPDLTALRIDPARLRAPAGQPIEVPTDDWPFLYMRERGVPFLPYGLTLAGFALLGGAAILFLMGRRAAVDRATPREPFDWPLFWLGAGFMLVETRAIAELSLLFGSTWTVTSVAISAILALALLSTGLAALLARSGRRVQWPWWVGLAAALLASYVFPFSALRDLGLALRALLGGLGAGLPLVFSGVVFVLLFARRRDAAGAFGANLLGGIAGGAAEYVALAAGNRALGLAAAALYACAAVATWRSRRATEPRSASNPLAAVPPTTVPPTAPAAAPAGPSAGAR